jgi:hypothetical protein
MQDNNPGPHLVREDLYAKSLLKYIEQEKNLTTVTWKEKTAHEGRYT